MLSSNDIAFHFHDLPLIPTLTISALAEIGVTTSGCPQSKPTHAGAVIASCMPSHTLYCKPALLWWITTRPSCSHAGSPVRAVLLQGLHILLPKILLLEPFNSRGYHFAFDACAAASGIVVQVSIHLESPSVFSIVS